MRVKPARGRGDCEPATSDRRRGAIARRSAILLGGTAVIALSMGQPAGAIVINDQVAAEAGGIANYYDKTNQYPNVVSLFSAGLPQVSVPGTQCTGSLINSRTILTAAHCYLPNTYGIPSISFDPIARTGVGVTSFVRHPDFRSQPVSIENDIAVISLARPVTNVAPVRLLTLQPGQAGFPDKGTTITMVGYGIQGTGSQPPLAWHVGPPEGVMIAVGTLITERPPHRSVRAQFGHTACMGLSLSRVHHAIFVVLC
jgi:subtilase-type serine protease